MEYTIPPDEEWENEPQRECSSLVHAAQDEYNRAARILLIESKEVVQVRNLRYQGAVDCTRLNRVRRMLKQRFFDEVYSPQKDLFQHNHGPEELWSRYFHWRLSDRLMSEPHIIRLILQICDTIPCSDPDDVEAALSHFVHEMPLPEYSLSDLDAVKWWEPISR